MAFITFFIGACSLLLSPASANYTPPLPTVDLGYEIHQAASYNATGGLYSFMNIRYGQAPVGNLRFAASVPPVSNRSTIQKGDFGGICPQAFPVWYLCGLGLLAGTIHDPSTCNASLIPPPDPRESEDCLFLDVVVPEKIFGERAKKNHNGAPVMVWIYGGGFAFGAKDQSGNPAGLIRRSQQGKDADDGVIYVSINYRGGAFGFLSGPNLQSNGTANAGLHDQRLALDWVQKNIHSFGGDPNRVTVFGQSAGGASIMHQITAYGGLKGKAPFQQAILQSPGFPPYPSNWQQDHLLQRFLAGLNVSTVQEARQLPYAALRAVNTAIVANSTYGSFTFSTAVDGDFTPALPGKLLLQGNFDHDVKLMLGYNSHETLYFTSPTSTTNAAFLAGLHNFFPAVQSEVVDYISETLYPQVYDGSLPYTTPNSRAMLSQAEIAFTCNTYYLARGFRNQSYGYRFSVPPGYHGEDTPYVYWNGPSSQVKNDSIALTLQSYLTNFAKTGQPNQARLPQMPRYGNGNQILDLNVTGITVVQDPDAIGGRCDWWQKALYF